MLREAPTRVDDEKLDENSIYIPRSIFYNLLLLVCIDGRVKEEVALWHYKTFFIVEAEKQFPVRRHLFTSSLAAFWHDILYFDPLFFPEV